MEERRAMATAYRIVHGDFGWHAVPVDGGEVVVFETRDAARAWCEQRLVRTIDDAPEPRSRSLPAAR